jgi:hypothetical protein
MEHAAPALFVALEQSAYAAAIRQSLWLYPVANVGHILALFCFAGAITVMDLRMAGAFAATSPGYVLRVARRVAIAAFIGLAVTGSMLFAAEASHVAVNPVFQFKLGLIGLGLVNIALFEWLTAPKVRDLPPLTELPATARRAGVISLAIWLAVAACGRSIAYF